jgi:hypothetical protein
MIEVPVTYDGARRPIPFIESLQRPERPALQIAAALDLVRLAPSILEAMRRLPDAVRVTDEAVRAGVATPSLLAPILEAIGDCRCGRCTRGSFQR